MKTHYLSIILIIVVLCLSFGLASPAFTQETTAMPLAERGPQHAGLHRLELVDDARGGRLVPITIFYPAIIPDEQRDQLEMLERNHVTMRDIAPDNSGAPYPIVLYSPGYTGSATDMSSIFEPLVSQGFIVVGVTHMGDTQAHTIVDRPLDILFAIDQLVLLNQDETSDLAGMMNVDQIGVIGISDGGYTALALTGARIDPELISAWDTIEYDRMNYLDPRVWFNDWEASSPITYHDQLMALPADGLWQPTTDSRIQAIISYLPCWTEFFGEQGLAEANLPTLIIAVTEDNSCPYAVDAVSSFTDLGSQELSMLSLVGQRHDLPNADIQPLVRQFVTAWFGYYLQGKTDYAQYLTENYAETIDNVVWGIDEAALAAP